MIMIIIIKVVRKDDVRKDQSGKVFFIINLLNPLLTRGWLFSEYLSSFFQSEHKMLSGPV